MNPIHKYSKNWWKNWIATLNGILSIIYWEVLWKITSLNITNKNCASFLLVFLKLTSRMPSTCSLWLLVNEWYSIKSIKSLVFSLFWFWFGYSPIRLLVIIIINRILFECRKLSSSIFFVYLVSKLNFCRKYSSRPLRKWALMLFYLRLSSSLIFITTDISREVTSFEV